MGTPQLLQNGQIFAERYRVERLIGRGGFGDVYRVTQLATEHRRALKVLSSPRLESAEVLRRFEFEAKVSARLHSCENVVDVVDAGLDKTTGLPFLVMELLEGEDLQHRVERKGPLPPAEVVSYIRQVAVGLERAHGYVDSTTGAKTPIVHRDLKPENLFLTRRPDGSPLVKILDFGIAKVIGDWSAPSLVFKGTPLFMASEQLAARPVSPATDVWPLGLIVFFLLTGKSYWRSPLLPDAELESLLTEVLNLPLLPPSSRFQQIGTPRHWDWVRGFDDWFSRCVNREPAQRFQSAMEAAQALERVMATPAAPEPTAAAEPYPSSAPRLGPVASEAEAYQDHASARSTQYAATSPSTPPSTAQHRRKLPYSALLAVGAILTLGLVLLAVAVGNEWSVTSERSHASDLPSSSLAVERTLSPAVSVSPLVSVLPASPAVGVGVVDQDFDEISPNVARLPGITSSVAPSGLLAPTHKPAGKPNSEPVGDGGRVSSVPSTPSRHPTNRKPETAAPPSPRAADDHTNPSSAEERPRPISHPNEPSTPPKSPLLNRDAIIRRR